jgi:hypothetical protein
VTPHRITAVLLALVAACSGDDTAVDAASCTCPAAEPPLAGRIIRVEDRRTSSTAVDAFAQCPAESILLGGGCYLEGPEELLMQYAGWTSLPTTYACEWDNPQLTEHTAVAWATCLLPAQ